jgi:CubicO group peptidase (beta-lactamase class C family)
MSNSISKFLVIAGIFFSNSLVGQTSLDSIKITSVNQIEDYVNRVMNSKGIPGLSLGLIKDNRIIYAKNFGVKDIISKIPITDSMLYDMASSTKMFTAIAILNLVEQHKLDLDSQVVKYLPYFKTKKGDYKKITLRHLLNHTSGLPRDLSDKDWETEESGKMVREMDVRKLKYRELEFIPGEKYSYSNLGFMALADVVSKTSGSSFEDFVTKIILKPCNMSASSMYKYSLADNQRVIPHHKLNGVMIPIYRKETGAIVGSGGLQTNIPDMLNWVIMNLNEGKFNNDVILEKETFKLLVTPAKDIKIRDIEVGLNRIGLGYEIGNLNGTTIYGHGGTTRGGFRNYTYIFPEKKAAIVIAGSILSEGIDDIYFKMVNFILDKQK